LDVKKVPSGPVTIEFLLPLKDWSERLAVSPFVSGKVPPQLACRL
jgi:hypothetical protein